jgi:hypothetical protein
MCALSLTMKFSKSKKDCIQQADRYRASRTLSEGQVHSSCHSTGANGNPYERAGLGWAEGWDAAGVFGVDSTRFGGSVREAVAGVIFFH